MVRSRSPHPATLRTPLKHAHTRRRWQQRRVVLTTTSVFFFKEGSPQIVDLIPLTEVDSITLERITGSGEALKSRSASTASLLLSGSAAALVPTKLQRSGSAAVHSIADATGETHFRRAIQSNDVHPVN